jgi:zinc transporter ZupT
MDFFKAALLTMVAIQGAFIGMLCVEAFGAVFTAMSIAVLLFNAFCVSGIIYIVYQDAITKMLED